MSRLAAIILAAGFSSRMGQFKPLLKINNETIIDRQVALFSSFNVDVYLVVGWRGDEVAAGIKNKNICIIRNPDYQQGMFTSIKAGIKHLREDHEAFFMIPVDIPLVRPYTIKRLIKAASDCSGQIIHPVFDKKRGHPPLIPTILREQVIAWESDGGLKSFLKTQEHITLEVAVPDANILLDMDHYSDYETIKQRLGRYEIPTAKECDVILNEICRIDPERKRHSQKVAEIAFTIARSLTGAGNHVDAELVYAAAWLHDIAKEKPHHETAAADILREMGFNKTADIVAVHTDLVEDSDNCSLEAKIVYLADKLVKGDALVTIEDRFENAIQRFGQIPDARHNIEKRKLRALKTKEELEKLTGQPLEEILRSG
jgi:molybdenum cofactor cytidylyltransferase